MTPLAGGPIHAMLPTSAVSGALASVVTRWELGVHEDLHEGYARRFNEGLDSGRGSEGMLHDWSGNHLHNLFWGGLEPLGKGSVLDLSRVASQIGPMGALGLDGQLHRGAMEIRGSGWACISAVSQGSAAGQLAVHNVANHEYPWGMMIPLVVVDLWEHAYLSRLTERAAYVGGLLGLVNWNVAIARLAV